MDLQIKGKKAIVAGGSAGMGRATAAWASEEKAAINFRPKITLDHRLGIHSGPVHSQVPEVNLPLEIIERPTRTRRVTLVAGIGRNSRPSIGNNAP